MKLAVVSVVFALISVGQAIDLVGRWQSAGAKGTLMCGDKPLKNAVIKLWDEDAGGIVLDTDDQMGCVRSNGNGEFTISGKTKELTTIDPYLKIYHDCNDKIFGAEKPCQRKWKVKLPKSYITNGETAGKLYDAGIINMEAKQSGESRNCEIIKDC